MGGAVCSGADLSQDQKITKKGKDKIVLTFTASSEDEIISWLLTYKKEARLIAPEGLVTRLKETLREMNTLYG